MGDNQGPVKVICIGGYGRSGSTLLLQMLGAVSDAVAIGEMSEIWTRSFRENQLCGCGKTFGECAFWSDVSRRAFGMQPGAVPADVLEAERQALIGNRIFPRIWVPALRSRAYATRMRSYAETFGRMYVAAAEHSPARAVIDSSKHPSVAWLLREDPSVELHLVHMVRDSRGVAHSWTRQRVRPEVHWQVTHMRQYSVSRSSMEWLRRNAITSTRKSSVASYLVVRYEDLVEDPGAVVARIGAATGIHFDTRSLRSGELTFGVQHTASGNPRRFETGPVRITADDEWKKGMRRRDKAVVSLLTAPGLHKYGYRVRDGLRTAR